MEIVAHKINTLERLSRLPTHLGVELDLRAMGSQIILNHDPFKGGESFVDYLTKYQHGLMVLNIKKRA